MKFFLTLILLLLLINCSKDNTTQPPDKEINPVGEWTETLEYVVNSNGDTSFYNNSEFPCMSDDKLTFYNNGKYSFKYKGIDTCYLVQTPTWTLISGIPGQDSSYGLWNQSGNTLTHTSSKGYVFKADLSNSNGQLLWVTKYISDSVIEYVSVYSK